MNNMRNRSEIDHDNAAWYLGSFVSVLLSGADTNGRCALMHASVIKGCEPPRHIHSSEDEIVYVLEGNVEFRVREARIELPAGAALLLPRGIEHSFRLNSNQAQLLLMLLPVGSDSYIKELNEVVSQLYRSSSLDLAPTVEQVVTIAARYGVEITGPP